MSIRSYKAVSVNSVTLENSRKFTKKTKFCVGIDVGKYTHYVTVRIATAKGEVFYENPWTVQRDEIYVLVEKLKVLNKISPLRIGMESTGSYGDPLRQALHFAKLPLLQVRTKITHDYAEVFDGVPSQHDGKDSAVIAELISQGKGEEWPFQFIDVKISEMRNTIDTLRRKKKEMQVFVGQIEAVMSRFWPTFPEKIRKNSAVLLKILLKYGGPEDFALAIRNKENTKGLFSRLLSEEKRQLLLDSAQNHFGLVQTVYDKEYVKELATDAYSCRRRIRELENRLAKLADDELIPDEMRKTFGKISSCIFMAILGSPTKYLCADAYVKAFGLNLTECSSGIVKGQIHISKRGNSLLRHYLYFAAMRMIRKSPVKQWYMRKMTNKKGKNGNKTGKSALIAVARKLLQGIYQAIKQNAKMDLNRLFCIGPTPKRKTTKKAVHSQTTTKEKSKVGFLRHDSGAQSVKKIQTQIK